MKEIILSKTLNIFKKLIFMHLIFLSLMSIFRLIFVNYYNPLDDEEMNIFMSDIVEAFILGFRLDLTVIGYIQIIPTLLLIVLYYLKKEFLLNLANKFLIYYLFLTYLLVSLLLFCDFAFYSYFKDHINILFFGLIDDDTKALIITMWQNYNVIMILSIFFIYLYILYKTIKFIILKQDKEIKSFFYIKISFVIFIILFLLNFLAVRGTFGMYPLGKMIPNVSTNAFINQISQNGFRAFTSAYGIRKKYLKREYNLIEETSYKNNIQDAFRVIKGINNIDETNLLNNIKYKTRKIDDKDYNIIVIMVESFGSHILEYNSEKFNILGELKQHFEEDILFTNFISSGNGTISSLQALLLNIPHRPKSFAFSQSIYKQTAFSYTSAFLYNNANYDTSFIYGGDLSWRNLGTFIKFQDYNNVEGKINIYNHLKNKNEYKSKKEDEYFHPWGVFDEYLYEYILDKLEQSSKKQFIVALSTNNHPPYNIPNDYVENSLIFSDKLKNHITGSLSLAKKRLASYAYALNSVGVFLTKFKKTKFADNTIIVITADNNTIDGIMKYDDKKLFNSKNIPLYFYLPKELKAKLNINTKVAGSHKDIFPTLYNLTLKDTSYLALGNDLFDSTTEHYGFNGSMIVNTNDSIFKLKSLKEKTNEKALKYYKASLAVTEYLITQTHKKNKKHK